MASRTNQRASDLPISSSSPQSRGAAVLTPDVMAGAQALLDEGLETADVARQMELKPDTLSKAIRAGRLHKRAKKKTRPPG